MPIKTRTSVLANYHAEVKRQMVRVQKRMLTSSLLSDSQFEWIHNSWTPEWLKFALSLLNLVSQYLIELFILCSFLRALPSPSLFGLLFDPEKKICFTSI